MKYLSLVFSILLLSACTKPYLKDEVRGQLIGTWKLDGLNDFCEIGYYWPDCPNSFDSPNAEYTLEIKKSGRIRSRKGSETIWCDKITAIEEQREYENSHVLIVSVKNRTITGSKFFFYLSPDSLGMYNFPNPDILSQDDPDLGGKFAVYRKE